MNYTYLKDLAESVEIPTGGIISKTIVMDEQMRAIVFGFDAGEELSEHTASVPAVIQIVRGEATITLGEDAFDASAGAWAHMPANMKHSILAKTPVVMLLVMAKGHA